MKRIVPPKNSGCGCLAFPVLCFLFCLVPPDDIPSPKLRMFFRIVRWTVFLLPLLSVLDLCGVPIPKGLLPISIVCLFPLLCFLLSKLQNALENFPTPMTPSEPKNEEPPKKKPIPFWLIFYMLVLLTPVLMINIPLFRTDNLHFGTLFFFAFGTVLCFIFTGFIRELHIHYAFAALLYTIVAGLLLIAARYTVFPFFWTLLAVCMGSLLVADKNKIIKARGGGTLTPGSRRLFLLVLGVFCLVGSLISFRQIKTNWELYTIRYAPVSEIQEIVFTQEESSRKVVLTQPEALAEFQKGMEESFIFSKRKRHPYSDYAPWWQVKLIWSDGRTRQFSLGNGTGYFSDAVFVRFTKSNDHFQSRALYKMLQPLLWPDGKGAGK